MPQKPEALKVGSDMLMFFWKREGWFILTTAAKILVLALIVTAVVFLVGFVRQIPTKGVVKPLSEEPQLSPFSEKPIVTYIVGCPEVKGENADTWDLLETGDALDQNCVVRTDETSSLDIRIQPGSVIRVMEGTVFSLESLFQQKVELELETGTVVARVKRLVGGQLFDFKTPVVVAGVRGTELIVSAEPDGTTVFGMSGKIEVVNPEFPDTKVFINLHEKSYAKEGTKPSEALAMSKEEIELYRALLDSLRENPVFIVGDNISFLPDSIQLTREALIVIEAIYDQLLSVQGNIIVVGHTADIGSLESQIEISEGRAQAVVDYLITLGMSSSRLKAVGVGSQQPVSHDESSMDRNRRVEFVIE